MSAKLLCYFLSLLTSVSFQSTNGLMMAIYLTTKLGGKLLSTINLMQEYSTFWELSVKQT
jgi:hypothetical protein